MNRKIMVIEDDQSILDMMDLALRRIGCEPVLVGDASRALEIIRDSPPSLVLLDLMMAPINGWEFLAMLRSEPGMKELPVILFTASPSVDEKLLSMNDPRLGVLTKPVSLDQLKAGIEKFLGPAGPG